MVIIDNNTVSLTAAYTEPTTNPDGSALTDLAYTSIYYHVNGGPKIVGPRTTASDLSGGGHIEIILIVPAPTGGVTDLAFYATATDTAGNESLPTTPVQFTVERLAPSSPTSFTIV